MMSSEHPGPFLATLAHFFVGESTMGETLDRVAQLACEAVRPARYVGITMMLDGKPGTYVFTHPDAPEIDQGQYAVGDGPCLHAFRDGEVVDIESMGTEPRWPEFTRLALEHDVHSTLSTPMVAAGRPVGALNCYAGEDHAFDAESHQIAQEFALQAAFVLANAQDYWDSRMMNENLSKAMASRAVIEQAKGIIMASKRCSEDEAFAMLVAQSQHENVKLRDVASWIVRDVTRG